MSKCLVLLQSYFMEGEAFLNRESKNWISEKITNLYGFLFFLLIFAHKQVMLLLFVLLNMHKKQLFICIVLI